MGANKQTKEEQVIFAFGPSGQEGDILALVFGIPTAAWEYMKDGMVHEFDLTKIGIPIKVIIFGAKDSQQASDLIMMGAQMSGVPFEDMRGKDLHFDPPKDKT